MSATSTTQPMSHYEILNVTHHNEGWKLFAKMLSETQYDGETASARGPAQVVRTLHINDWWCESEYQEPPSWDRSWPEHDLYPDLASFLEAKMKQLSLPEVLDSEYGDTPANAAAKEQNSIALLLPLFPALTRLSAYGDSIQDFRTAAELIERQIRHRQITSPSCHPQAFTSLSEVNISICDEPGFYVEIEDVLRMLRLPALEELSVYRMLAYLGANEGRDEIAVSLSTIDLAKEPIPLRKLNFDYCNISRRAIDLVLAVTNKLEDFRLSIGETLQRLEYVIDPDWFSLAVGLSYNLPTDKWTRSSSCDMREFEDLAIMGLNSESNLRAFSQLQYICIDAELLLNGYGLLTAVSHQITKKVWKLDNEIVIPKLLFNGMFPSSEKPPMPPGAVETSIIVGWHETNPDDGPSLDQLLPPSVETLILRCRECQDEPLRRKLKQVLGEKVGEVPTAFLNLKRVLRLGKYGTHWPWDARKRSRLSSNLELGGRLP